MRFVSGLRPQSKRIEAKRVVIETEEGSYILQNPEVIEIDMQGQKSLQITGAMVFEDNISEEDTKMVAEQAGCSEEEARTALKKTKGDIAQAILLLKGK
ncbi:MAG: nascent polypeptide-associated complex protein [Candidatus Bilamarchaeaceae archaeon]